MATFVLIHGAWEAGWVWTGVERHLRAAGHAVFRPSLTGLGERSHLLTRDVDLETHIADVLGLIKWERLQNATVVGHSYGGMVAAGVADRAHDRIGSLIYLDAFMPKDGQCLLDLVPPEGAAAMRRRAEEDGEGWYLPLSAAAAPLADVTHASELALLGELCTRQPLATMTQKLRLDGNHLNIAKKAFVLAGGYVRSPFRKFAGEARALGWPVEELPTHHFTMLSLPQETAEALIRHAA